MLYSYSRVSLFEKCPLAYKYRYVRRLKPKGKSIEAFMGWQVHKAIEYFFQGKKSGGTPTVSDVLAYFRDSWSSRFSEDIFINREGYTTGDYLNKGEEMIEFFVGDNLGFDGSRIIGIEKRVHADLFGDGRLRFIGFIDRLDCLDDGVYEIHDYKTSRRLPSEKQLLKDRQLCVYEKAVRQVHPEADKIVHVWHYLAHKNKYELTRTPQQLNEAVEGLSSSVSEIESAVDSDCFPANKSRLCGWCEYKLICQDDDKTGGCRQSRLAEY